MSIVIQSCKFCQTEFNADSREIKRDNAKFCSRKCSGAFKTANTAAKVPNFVCAYCHTSFYRAPSRVKYSKSTLLFCTRKHKDLAQKIGGIEAIHLVSLFR